MNCAIYTLEHFKLFAKSSQGAVICFFNEYFDELVTPANFLDIY